MKKKRHTTEQIIGILRQADAGGNGVELCGKHEVSPSAYYVWKTKYGGRDIPDAMRLKELEHENSWLKLLRRESALENAALKDILGTKWLSRRQGAMRWKS